MSGGSGSRGRLGALPPPERGRVGVGVAAASRVDRTIVKTARARRLRRDATDVERRLWYELRNAQMAGASFRRQHPAGRYILDFYCRALQLAVELDGGQHARAESRDHQRDEWLKQRGVTVLRFWNSDITKNLHGVLEVIAGKIAELKSQGLTPTRRWRHSRCFASAFLALRTAAEGHLCLPLSGGGASSSRHR
jgi:very-short-patch-repair endonuclease